MSENIPNKILKKGKELRAKLLPAKSSVAYEKVYQVFTQWKKETGVNEVTEDVILAYLDERSQKLCPASLWPVYSMLKATLKARENINIEIFGAIVPYLKNLNVGYRPKKSKVLTRREIETFLEKAEEKEYLFVKVALMFGIAGACRKIELYNMNFEDIQNCGDVLIVNIPDTKTHKPRKFTIINEGFGINSIDLYRRYVGLRPTNAPGTFFLKYYREKCYRQVVGINTFRAIPRKIATFLKLGDPKSYSGHSFHRSSATILANAGRDITSLKRHGGWESSKVAESYIEDSIEEKIKTAQKISSSESAKKNPVYDVVVSNRDSSCSRSQNSGNLYFHKCTFNFDVKDKN